MKPQNKPDYRLPVDELYPHLSPQQRAEAEYFLDRYLEVVRRILEEDGI